MEKDLILTLNFYPAEQTEKLLVVGDLDLNWAAVVRGH
jgi:hypothetical protein